MITHQNGLLAPPTRPLFSTSSHDKDRERERLRQELLQRILDRENRRRALRHVPR
jgi:hypothetical protein